MSAQLVSKDYFRWTGSQSRTSSYNRSCSVQPSGGWCHTRPNNAQLQANISTMPFELEFGDISFWGGRKTGQSGEKKRSQSKAKTNNKLNPQYGTRSESNPWYKFNWIDLSPCYLFLEVTCATTSYSQYQIEHFLAAEIYRNCKSTLVSSIWHVNNVTQKEGGVRLFKVPNLRVRSQMSIVEFDRPPSWSFNASETAESTKYPWVELSGLKASGLRGVKIETLTASHGLSCSSSGNTWLVEGTIALIRP